MHCPFVFHRGLKKIGDFRKLWGEACVAAGLGYFETVGEGKDAKKVYRGLLIHDLRRSGIRDLVRGNVREIVAMSISGHKTRSTFDRYNIVSPQDIIQAFNAVDAYRKQAAESKIEPIRKAESE